MTYNPPTTLQIEHRALIELTPDPKNARLHSKAQIKQIASSIKVFGFNVPVLIDEAGNVIAGHGRLLAAQQLKMQTVPTIRLSHLTPEQAKAFAIADNRLTEISTWDDRLLAETLKGLSECSLDFSLDVTGFSVAEIDIRIGGLDKKDEEIKDPADDLPKIPEGPSVSQLGDLWLLDHHRLLCGSALTPASYEMLMAGKRAAMAFTDPPYNVPIDGHVSGLGEIKHREFAMAVGEMSTQEFTKFLLHACKLMAQHSADGSIHFVCMDWRHVGELWSAGHQAYPELKNICVWAKDNGGMGSLYRSQHELVFVFKNGHEPHRNNVELGKNGRYRTNVWRYPSANSMSKGNEEGNLLAMHPTVKPVAMVADAILDVSARKDIVLDPFLGSGTTLMAAERTGRHCYGMEFDPLYVDTAIRRWQKYTGSAAVHAVTGKTFDETAAMEVSHV